VRAEALDAASDVPPAAAGGVWLGLLRTMSPRIETTTVRGGGRA